MKSQHSGYGRLAVMAALSFVAMYVLMYSMVDGVDDVYHNLNQAYMAALMAAPMVVIEMWLMPMMYPRRTLNVVILVAASAVGALCFGLIRAQGVIEDRQFLRSMIPHHSAAILMCEQASIDRADIRELCASIVASQRAEIQQMRELLRRP